MSVINEHAVNAIAGALQIPAEELKADLFPEAAATDTKLTAVLPTLVIKKKGEYDQFIDNLGKQKYDEAKGNTAGLTLKLLHKQVYGEEKSYSPTISHEEIAQQQASILKEYKDKVLKEASRDIDPRIREKEEELDRAKKLLTEKENKILELNATLGKTQRHGSLRSVVTANLSGVKIAGEENVAKNLRIMFENMVLNELEEREESGQKVVYRNGIKQVNDSTLALLTTDEVIKKMMIENLPVVTESGGQGGHGTQTTHTTSTNALTDEKLKTVNTLDELRPILAENKINPGTPEEAAVIHRVVKLNSAFQV